MVFIFICDALRDLVAFVAPHMSQKGTKHFLMDFSLPILNTTFLTVS